MTGSSLFDRRRPRVAVAAAVVFVVVVSGAAALTTPTYRASVVDDGGVVADAAAGHSATAGTTLTVSYVRDRPALTQVDVYSDGDLVTRFDLSGGSDEQTIGVGGDARTYELVAHNRTGAVVGRATVRVRADSAL